MLQSLSQFSHMGRGSHEAEISVVPPAASEPKSIFTRRGAGVTHEVFVSLVAS